MPLPWVLRRSKDLCFAMDPASEVRSPRTPRHIRATDDVTTPDAQRTSTYCIRTGS